MNKLNCWYNVLEVADIIFLIDGSRSIYFKDFITMKVFMETLINKTQVGENRVQFGVIQFSTQTQLEFQLNQYYDKDKLMQAVGDIQQLEGLTSTGKALNFTAKYFDEAQGGRPHERQYLIVITDGEAQDEVYTPAKAIRDKGITVFAIGVYNANNSQLVDIAGSQDQVYHVENFDALGSLEKLISFEVIISQLLCNGSKLGKQLSEIKSKCFCPLMITLCFCVCTFAACELSKADIVFLLDSSESIKKHQFQLEKDFLKDFTDMFEISQDKFQFGVAQYSTNQKAEFYLNQYHDRMMLNRSIQNIVQLQEGTKTGKALKYIDHFFQPEKGSRKKEGVPQFLLVITDGESQDDVSLPAEALRRNNIIIFALGIDKVEKKHMVEITGDPQKTYIIKEFTDLSKFKKRLVRTICVTEEQKGKSILFSEALHFSIQS
uniref:VWFA domain-containing protein n=1 Tax=Callorhinchus milii TaxID=7868 RepID=A0A4W3GDT0_CALMI